VVVGQCCLRTDDDARKPSSSSSCSSSSSRTTMGHKVLLGDFEAVSSPGSRVRASSGVYHSSIACSRSTGVPGVRCEGGQWVWWPIVATQLSRKAIWFAKGRCATCVHGMPQCLWVCLSHCHNPAGGCGLVVCSVLKALTHPLELGRGTSWRFWSEPGCAVGSSSKRSRQVNRPHSCASAGALSGALAAAARRCYCSRCKVGKRTPLPVLALHVPDQLRCSAVYHPATAGAAVGCCCD
jgi:hypothetical protein